MQSSIIMKPRPRAQFFIGSLGLLSALTNVKISDLQIIDCMLLFITISCIIKVIHRGFIIKISSKIVGLARAYGLFLFFLSLMAVLALRMRYYPLSGMSPLKAPVILSASKIVQLLSVICGFLWLTNAFAKDRRLFANGTRVYWLAGVASSYYGVACYALMSIMHSSDTTIPWLGAYETSGDLRVRGFFVEGGPFGVYLVSVLCVGIIRNLIFKKKQSWLSTVFILMALFLSASKAGFVVAILLTAFAVVSISSLKKRVALTIIAAAIIGAGVFELDLGSKISAYFYDYQTIEDQIATRGNDYNLVLGRIAALYIVPRMIEEHPLTGIGFGNYPIMRNDPVYLGHLPAVTEAEDLPALGLPGITAEVGIPATIWLVALLLTPYIRTRKASIIISATALFQPLAHLVGVQLTFFYPWFVSACALAAYYHREQEADGVYVDYIHNN